MKKFFSLMLVAALLVSALPFQAFAAGTDEIVPVNANATCGGSANGHTWTRDPSQDVAATCNDAGIEGYKCTSDPTKCAAKGQKTIAKLGHRLDAGTVVKQPTCETEGEKRFECSVCHGTKTEPIAALGHALTESVTQDATCTGTGTKKVECSRCDYERTDSIDAEGHTWGAYVVTKAATCEEAGVETRTCSGCGATEDKEIPVSTIHNYVGNACSVCGKAKDLNDTASAHGLRFINEETDEDTIVSVRPGYVIDAPAGKKVKNMKFKYWSTGRNGTGTRVYDEQSVFGTADGQISATTFYAYYVEDKNDGLSYVDIIVRRYVNGKAQGADITLFEDIEFEDGDSIYDWLYAKRDSEIATKLFERVSADEYQWKNRYFYNYWSDEVMTKADLKADGSKAILIKVESLKSNAANVKLYLHKSSTSEDPFRILDMTGYTAGNYVSRSAVADLVEKYYSYKSIGNLYNEEDWEELMNGEDNNGRSKVLVEDNGYTEIHVVVTNANTKSNSKADSSNPKTGDYITIAVGTMVLAAAAVVTLAELKKRKMI